MIKFYNVILYIFFILLLNFTYSSCDDIPKEGVKKHETYVLGFYVHDSLFFDLKKDLEFLNSEVNQYDFLDITGYYLKDEPNTKLISISSLDKIKDAKSLVRLIDQRIEKKFFIETRKNFYDIVRN